MTKLYIKQKVFSIGERFSVKDAAGNDKYFVQGSFLSIPKTFTITDTAGSEVATITKKTFSFMPKFFVEIAGQPIITIERELTFLKARYRIDSEDLSIQGDWWSKNYEITQRGQVVANISEAWFTWGDSFEVDIYKDALETVVISLVAAIDFVKDQEAAASSSGGHN